MKVKALLVIALAIMLPNIGLAQTNTEKQGDQSGPTNGTTDGTGAPPVVDGTPTGPTGGSDGQTSRYDERFLQQLIASERGEVELAMLIMQQTSSVEVRALAAQLITDHGQTLQQAEALATEKQIDTAEGILPDQRRLRERITQAQNPNDKDKFYVLGVIKGHEDSIEELIEYDDNGADPQMRGLAEQELPVLIRHLALAVATRGEVENDATSLSESSSTSSSTSSSSTSGGQTGAGGTSGTSTSTSAPSSMNGGIGD